MKNSILGISTLTLILISCSPKSTESTVVEDVKAPMTSEAEAGRTLYEAKCQKCHKLKVVDKYSSEKWAKVLPVMAKKAEISDSEKNTINDYIQWELVH